MSTTKGTSTTSVRKLQPRAKMPPAEVLSGFSYEDVEILRRRLDERIECVFNPVFHKRDAEQNLLTPIPEADRSAGGSRRAANDDSGADLLADSTGQNWTSEQERHMFLKLNYCRYRAMRILRQFRNRELTREAAAELVYWEKLSQQTRSDIVRQNVALVMAMARRTRLTGVDQADLISEGNLALLRAVDKFDCSRGFKFSTYACRAILKAFSRVATRAARYRGHFPTEFDPALEKDHHVENKRQSVEEDCIDELRSILGRDMACLSEVEAKVIKARFAIDTEPNRSDIVKGKTLEQVGEMIGVTKERVRQIQNKALAKLRQALERNVLTV